jgi:ribosomal protein L23
MSNNFYSLVKSEISTEKTQVALEKNNIRSFICLPTVRKEHIQVAFEQSFGYAPEKINILTFYKTIVNKRNRSQKKVAMKKVLLRLPKGKELTQIKEKVIK